MTLVPPSAAPNTERSTLYFDALSSPTGSNDDRDAFDAAAFGDKHRSMNDSFNTPVGGGGGGGGITTLQAIAPALNHDVGEAVGNPFSSQEGGTEPPRSSPAVDGDGDDTTPRNAIPANGEQGDIANAAPQTPIRSNSAMAVERPPAPKRPASFHSATHGVSTNAAIVTGDEAGHRRANSNSSSTGKPILSGSAPNDAQPYVPMSTSGTLIPGGQTNEGTQPNGANEPPSSGEDSLHARDQSADSALTPKQRSKLEKIQRKETKKLSKIIKQEGKAEKQALSTQIHDLEELQKLQRAAVKREAKTHTKHAALVESFQKLSQQYFTLRTKYESQQAQIRAEETELENARQAVMDIAEKIKEKTEMVDANRIRVGVEDKEREVRLGELNAKSSGDKKGVWK